MALQLSTATNMNVAGSYWKILAIDLYYTSNTANVRLALYLDQASSESSSPLITKNYTIPSGSFVWGDGMTPNDPRAAAYSYLKGLPEFQSAASV